jgi:hypothetical protein
MTMPCNPVFADPTDTSFEDECMVIGERLTIQLILPLLT